MKVGKNGQIVSKRETLELLHLPNLIPLEEKLELNRRSAEESAFGIVHPNGFHHHNLTRSSI